MHTSHSSLRDDLVAGLRTALAHESGVDLGSATAPAMSTAHITAQRISLVMLRAKQKLGLSDEQVSALETDVASHLLAASALIPQTARVSAALREGGIDHLVYKGAALGALQGGVSSRGAGDVDVLVEPADIARVDAILRNLGYHPGLRMPPLHHQWSWRAITTLDREVPYYGQSIGVDLHWRISPPRHLFDQPRRLIARATTVEVGGEHIPTPAAGDALAMACFHAYYDRFAHLRALVDVHRLIPLATQAPLPGMSRALGRLTAGVLELHRELFPGILDDDTQHLLAQLPPALPMVKRVWERFGAEATSLRPAKTPAMLWRMFAAEFAYDHPVESLPRWVTKRLFHFPYATGPGQHTSLLRAFGSQVMRIGQGKAH